MRLFKRKTKGYCNISEPVSDLDPARISAIKAQHAKVEVTAREDKITTSNDDTFITETVTLETSQSAESSKCKQEAASSASQPEASTGKDKSAESPQIKEQDASAWTTKPKSNEQQFMADPRVKLEAKTPETFFEGKNRKRIMDHASQAPTEHQIGTVSMGEREIQFKEPLAYVNPAAEPNRGDDNQSQSSDLDKTFAPQLVTVNSDITDPSFGHGLSSKKRNQKSWKKLKKLRRYFHDSLSSKACEQKRPETFFDMFIDAICSYPGEKKS
jgi:hypothetical protein